MRALADRYCALVERAPVIDREVFAGEVLAVLAALVAAAVALPDVEPSDADLLRPSQESWRQRHRDLGQVLGDWDSYWVALDPYAADPSTLGVGSLSDDLADIWRDLEEGRLALAAGAREADVTWGWRFGYRSHWGAHATAAMSVLHHQLTS